VILAGWTMIQVFDTAAARQALARKLACPDCGQPLRPWGMPASVRFATWAGSW